MLMCSSYQPVLAPSLINKCKSVPRVKLLNVPQSWEVRVALALHIMDKEYKDLACEFDNFCLGQTTTNANSQ